jgi:hypothetical protein
MDGIKTILTETRVEGLRRKKIGDLKTTSIKMERASIILTKTIDRKKIIPHRRNV